MKPLISVVIPTYKRGNLFLEKAINSVLNQTYMNIEIIVIDDNIPLSEDRIKTELIMKKFIKNKKIKYFKNEKNLGGAISRNEGIKRSKGTYISFLDDDDIYLENKIKNQFEFMSEKNFDMSFTNLKLFNMKNKLIDFREYKDIKNFNNLFKYHLLKHITGTSTFMYKKSFLEKINGFSDCKMGQEFYLMVKTILSKGFIGYCDKSDVIGYIHQGVRISNGINKIKGEKKLLKFKKNYFNIFTYRERKYIKFRHHVVMYVTGLRNKMLSVILIHSFLAFLSSPYDMLYETLKHIRKIFFSKNYFTLKN